MAYTEDVNVNLNVLTGTMAGVTAIVSGMSALTSSFGAMGTAAGESFGALDGLLVSATALITTFGVKSAEAFGEFEQGMKIVQTVSGQTGYAINELGQKANELSISYRTAIGDITTGLQTLGRAGLNSATTQMEVLESGLQTAKLEGRNLNGVLEEIIQNTAMLGGNLKSINFGEQSEYLNSLMVGTSMTAPINSHDISQTLQYAGGTAAAAGANLDNRDKLEDLMGTVAAFAQKGVKGSMAGTSLRAFFTKPASQDKSVTEGLDRIGLTADDLWEDGGNSMKKVSDQIGIIQRQMKALNLSTMDQVEIWGKIVGPKMGQQMMKLDSSSIKELTRDIESAKSAEELATKTLQTYTQKVAELQQQGEMAFREFGEKAVVFLTPVVEILSKIMGIFSTDEGSLAGFTAITILVSHGIQRIWSMATTLYRQIQSMISAVISGIEQINGIAGGSSAGFTQSAASVDFLNSKLSHTNMELAAMQAQFMKLGVSSSGTGVMPLGIVGPGGRVPRNMINYANQEVFKGNGILGQRGVYYDPSETKKLEDAYRSKMATQNAENQALREKYSGENSKGVMQYRDPATGKFISQQAFNKALPIMSQEQIDKNVKQSLGSGAGKLHSSLMSMTEKEYKAFMKDLNKASARINSDANYEKGGRYVDEKGRFNNRLYQQDAMKDFNRQRQLEYLRNARQEGNIHRNTVGGQTFMRAFKLDPMRERMFEVERTMQKQAQLKQFEAARAQEIQQQKALAGGRTGGFINKAQQVTTNRLKAYSNALQWGTNKVRGFGTSLTTGIKRATGQLDLSFKAMGQKMEVAIANVAARMEEAPITFEEALIQIQEEMGVTSKELSIMLSETSGGFATLNAELLGLGLTTAEGEVATATHTAAVLADTAATEQGMVAKMLDKLGGAASSLSGIMGGPLMAGMMVFMLGMQAIQKSQQAWQEKMQEATNKLSESVDKMTESEDKVKEIYSSEYGNMSEADLDKVVDMQYSTIYDSFYQGSSDRSGLGKAGIESDVSLKGSEDKETGEYKMLTEEEIAAKNEEVDAITLAKNENVEALKENTMQLVAATAAYNQAQNRQVEQFTDSSWGSDSFTADFTDQLGEWQEEIWNVGSWFSGVDRRSGFLQGHSPVLTGSQGDSNYAGSTDFAGIFAANVQRFDEEYHYDYNKQDYVKTDIDDPARYVKPFQQFFGKDFDRIISLMGSMDNKMSGVYGENVSGKDALYTHAANMASMTPEEMGVAQMSLKNNTEDFQKLSKQMFRYEQSRGFKAGRTAYGDYGNISQAIKAEKSGDKQAYEKAMKKLGRGSGGKLSVQDRNLDNTIKKLMAMTDNRLSYQNILAMGQLQQLQDMYTVANESVAPGIMQTVQAVYDNVSTTGQAANHASGAESGAVSAANNAAAIAAFIGAEAQGAAEKAAFQKYNRAGGKYGTQEEFVAAVARGELPQYEREILKSLEGTSWGLANGDNNPEHVSRNADRLYKYLEDSDASYQSKLDTATWGILQYAQKATMEAYDQSTLGEYGGGQRATGDGSGGGDGDGSDKDNKENQGTRKERVDLVLCNKKEIPKLNVNLFKKPPNFTVLNKNFKLRDIKINSQDKPKAIMNAIKNGIIETQKRMDPKIIQDESAEFNPVEATEGNSVPKGNTKTTT